MGSDRSDDNWLLASGGLQAASSLLVVLCACARRAPSGGCGARARWACCSCVVPGGLQPLAGQCPGDRRIARALLQANLALICGGLDAREHLVPGGLGARRRTQRSALDDLDRGVRLGWHEVGGWQRLDLEALVLVLVGVGRVGVVLQRW
jgi:hypothetical protein